MSSARRGVLADSDWIGVTGAATLGTMISTERWMLDPWVGGPDPTDLALTWARKPKVVVDGRRSCPELAVLARLRLDGWDGFWVNSFGRGAATGLVSGACGVARRRGTS